MPVSTRQATPGPSTLGSTALQPSNQSKNTKKRANSETQDDGREVKKKIKIGTEGPPHATNGKDKKKKKRKKKRRASVVRPDPETEEHARPTRRSAPPSSNGQAVTTSGDSAPNSQAANHVKADEADDEPVLSSSDKGKAKANSESPSRRAVKSPSVQPIASGSGSAPAVSPTGSDPQDSEIARLKEQLAVQTKLLERHESHLGHHHQSLTCQICLELMYKPYALSPCGHITCYGCLVRWFTAPLNPVVAAPDMNAVEPAPQAPDTIETILSSATARNGSYIRRRKKCPICRAVVVDRPVEMWGIKDMVAALVRSELVDIPVAPGPSAGEEVANADPWRNVFRRAGPGAHGWQAVPFFPFAAPAPREQDDEDRAQMGWYDAEDGGIHRCIDCYHEIWGGICSGCQREYPGHGLHNDDDEDDGSDVPDFFPFPHRMDIFGDDDDDESDEPDEVGGWRYAYMHEPSEDDYDDDDDDDDEDMQDPPRQDPPRANLPQFIPARPGRWQRARADPEVVEVDTEEDEEEDSIYGGSFIDDDHDDGNGDDHGGGEDEDEDDDDEVEFVEPFSLRVRLSAERRKIEERRRRYEEEEDNDDEDEDDADSVSQATREARVQFDDESDGSSADEQYQRGSSRHVEHRHIVDETDSDGDGSQVDDEDDDDDDEDMDPPIRYTRRNIPVWHEVDDDDGEEEEEDPWG